MPNRATRNAVGMDYAPASSAAPSLTPTTESTLRRRALSDVVEHRARLLAAVAVLAITAGGLLHLAGTAGAGDRVWAAAVALLATVLTFEVGRTIVIDRHMGVDTIAPVGSLALGQELAGVVVGLMFSGGAALEDVASTRARRELTALVQRAPRVAPLSVRAGL